MPVGAERSKLRRASLRLRWLARSAATASAGLIAGLAVFALTLRLSNSNIGGPGWSLRGNGALIVLFALGPSLLAGGWVWLADHHLRSALLAAVVTLALALLLGFGPIALFLFGSSGPAVSRVVTAVSLGLALLAGVLIARGAGRLPGLVALLVALVLTIVVSNVGYILAPLFLAIVLATPVLAHRWSGQLAAECILLGVAMLAGNFGGQFAFRSA